MSSSKQCVICRVDKGLDCTLLTYGSCEIYYPSWFYEGRLKSFRPSLRETRDMRPLDRESNRSWCHRHTKSMIKLFWSQPMAPWASRAVYGQGEKFLALPTPDLKLETSGRWVRTRTGAGVTSTLLSSFLDCSPWIHGMSSSTPHRVPTQWSLVPSFSLVVG